MQERDLEKAFSAFLIEKGYSKASLLYEASIHQKLDGDSGNRYLADLLILDTEFDAYLALIEFKNKDDDSSFKYAFRQVKTYLEVLDKPELPTFLVVPSREHVFDIYKLSSNNWKKIEEDEFPVYQTLQSKIQADNKTFLDQINEKKLKEVIKKKRIIKDSAYSTLISLTIAIITVIIFSLRLFENNNDFANLDTTSITIAKLNTKIINLEEKITNTLYNDTLFKFHAQTQQLGELNSRIKNIEMSIKSTPDRLLKIQEINFEFKELKNSILRVKEISDIKITNLKEKLDQVIIWTSGLIITIIGSIIGFAINAFRKS